MALKFKPLNINTPPGASIKGDIYDIHPLLQGDTKEIRFNTSLTDEEVYNIIKNADLHASSYGSSEYTYYLMWLDDNGKRKIQLKIVYDVQLDGYTIISQGINGYKTQYVYICEGSYLTSSANGYSAGWQPGADKIIIEGLKPSSSTTQYHKDNCAKLVDLVKGYRLISSHDIDLEGNYEPVILTVTENKAINTEDYIKNQQMPVTIDVKADNLVKILDARGGPTYLFYNAGYYIENTDNYGTETKVRSKVNIDGVYSYSTTQKYTDFSGMFYSVEIERLIPFDTSNAKNMYYTFYGCKVDEPINILDFLNFDNVIDITYFCSLSSNLLPENINLELPNVKGAGNAFSHTTGIKSAKINFHRAPNRISSLFYNCKDLEYLEIDLRTSNELYGMGETVTANGLASNCPNLKEVIINCNDKAYFDGSYGIGGAVSGCTSLTKFELNNVKNNNTGYIYNTFQNCVLLEETPILDVSRSSSVGNPIQGCTNMKNARFINIDKNMRLGGSNMYCELLTTECLINICKECLKTSSAKTLNMGEVNLAKIANVYVKFKDGAETTFSTWSSSGSEDRYKEENIIKCKGDIEVCESTDEGAMTIAQYMSMKSWTIQ